MGLQKLFIARFDKQKIAEAKELLNVQELSWDKSLPDSAAKIKSDSLRSQASAYIRLYEEYGNKLQSFKSVADSLNNIYEQSVKKVNQLQQIYLRGL